MDKLWEIQMVDNDYELQFEIIEYEVLKTEDKCIAVREASKPNAFVNWFELRLLERIFIGDFPWTYTRDFSHIKDLEIKLCEAKANSHKQKIEDMKRDMQEEERLQLKYEKHVKELSDEKV